MPVVSPMGPTSGGYVPGYQVNARPPKKHRGLKIFGIVMASILGAIALVYFAGVIVFSGRFFPQSTIIGMDISGKTPEEVHQMLDNVLGDYTFKVEGPGGPTRCSSATTTPMIWSPPWRTRSWPTR